MKAKEFIKGKKLKAVETVDNVILSLVIDNVPYGLKVDTSNIPAGTKVTRTFGFRIIDDLLKVGSLSVNLADTDMLGNFEQE
jgi:hypothetical protein